MEIGKLYEYAARKTGCSEATIRKASAVMAVGWLAGETLSGSFVLKQMFDKAPGTTAGLVLGCGAGFIHAWCLKKQGSVRKRLQVEMRYAAAGLALGLGVDYFEGRYAKPSEPATVIMDNAKAPLTSPTPN